MRNIKKIPFGDPLSDSVTVATFASEISGRWPFQTYKEHEYDAFYISVLTYDPPFDDRIFKVQRGGRVTISLTNCSPLSSGLSFQAKETAIVFPLHAEGLRKVAEESMRTADEIELQT